MRQNARFALSLVAALVVATTNATPVPSSQTKEDGQLLAIDALIPLCLAHQPEQGKKLEAARRTWTAANPEREHQYRQSLAADAAVAKATRLKLTEVARPIVAGAQGATYCSNGVRFMHSLGAAPDFDTAVAWYFQQIVRIDTLGTQCVRSHPSLAAQIASDERKWESDDAETRKTALARVDALSKEPGSLLPQLRAKVGKAWRETLAEYEKSGEGETYCRQVFAELASGKNRKTHAEFYEALRRGSGAN